MRRREAAAAGVVMAGFLALGAAGCANVVLVPGESDGTGGAGTGATTSDPGTTGTGTSTGTDTSTDTCAPSCTGNPAAQTCTCTPGCDPNPSSKASCAPIVDLLGNHKIECVCTVEDFSGVCFEHDLSKLCDFKEGCCAKYFSGK